MEARPVGGRLVIVVQQRRSSEMERSELGTGLFRAGIRSHTRAEKVHVKSRWIGVSTSPHRLHLGSICMPLARRAEPTGSAALLIFQRKDLSFGEVLRFQMVFFPGEGINVVGVRSDSG